MPKVFIVQETKHNIIGAMKYGELEILLPAHEQIVLSATNAGNKMKRKLSKFHPDEDFLILIGDPVAMGLAFALVSHYTHGRFRVLKWDRQEQMYYPIQVDLFNKGESRDE